MDITRNAPAMAWEIHRLLGEIGTKHAATCDEAERVQNVGIPLAWMIRYQYVKVVTNAGRESLIEALYNLRAIKCFMSSRQPGTWTMREMWDTIGPMVQEMYANEPKPVKWYKCRNCGKRVFIDENLILIDKTGGDVCGYLGGDEPHEI